MKTSQEVNFEKRGKLTDHQTCMVCGACICDGHKHRLAVFISALFFVLVLLVPPVFAANYQCADVPCLIAAMEASAYSIKRTRIFLAPSTYTLQAVHNNLDGANGLPTTYGQTIIEGNAIIERDPGAPPFRLFHVSDGGNLTLRGLILQGGHDASDFGGGAIANRGETRLEDVWVRFNVKTSGPGTFTAGAAGVRNIGGHVIIANSLIDHNEVTENAFVNSLGGGILNTNWGNFAGSMLITDSLIHNNTATGTGGAVHNGANLVVLRSAIFGNESVGAAMNNQVGAPLVLTRSTVALNDGGGISGGNLTLTYSTLFANPGFDIALDIAAPHVKGNIIGRCRSDFGTGVQSGGFNVVQAGCTGLGALDLTGDPRLDPFDTDQAVLPLRSDSPAIRLAPLGECPEKDQLGRRVRGGCDSGAVQFRR